MIPNCGSRLVTLRCFHAATDAAATARILIVFLSMTVACNTTPPAAQVIQEVGENQEPAEIPDHKLTYLLWQAESTPNRIPAEGLVRDGRIAVLIAETAMAAAWNESQAIRFRPYRVALRNDRWIVFGSEPEMPPDVAFFGRIPYVEVAVRDGQIMRLTTIH